MRMDELEHRVARKELPDPTFHVEPKHPNRTPFVGETEITGRRTKGARLTNMADFFGTREPKKAPPVRPVVLKSVQEQLAEVQAAVHKTEAETKANWAKNKY